MWIALIAALFLSLLPHGTKADYNITIDNTDTSIVYKGIWGVLSLGGYDYGGSQNLVDLGDNLTLPGATSTATFTFTGTAIYYMSPLWPYRVDTVLTLDSEPPFIVNLTAPGQLVPIGSTGATVVSEVRWGRTGLTNFQHTLVLTLAPGGRYIVLDALIYTAVPPPITTGVSSSLSSASSSSSASSTAPPSTSASDKQTKALIAVASTMGTLFALTLIAIVLFFILRRPKQPSPAPTPNVVPFPPNNATQITSQLSDKGTRLYGLSPSMSYTTNGANSVPSTSTPPLLDVLSPVSPQSGHPDRRPTFFRSPQSDAASTVFTTGPPPYQHGE